MKIAKLSARLKKHDTELRKLSRFCLPFAKKIVYFEAAKQVIYQLIKTKP